MFGFIQLLLHLPGFTQPALIFEVFDSHFDVVKDCLQQFFVALSIRVVSLLRRVS